MTDLLDLYNLADKENIAVDCFELQVNIVCSYTSPRINFDFKTSSSITLMDGCRINWFTPITYASTAGTLNVIRQILIARSDKAKQYP